MASSRSSETLAAGESNFELCDVWNGAYYIRQDNRQSDPLDDAFHIQIDIGSTSASSGYETLVSFRESGGWGESKDVFNVRTIFVLKAGGLLYHNHNALFPDLARKNITKFCQDQS